MEVVLNNKLKRMIFKLTIQKENHGEGVEIYRNYEFETIEEAQAKDWNPEIADMIYTVSDDEEKF